MIRATAILALLLAVSVATNLMQWRSATRADAVAPVQDKLDQAEDRAGKTDAIADARPADDAALSDEERRTADVVVERVTEYVERTKILPPAPAGPGAERVQAWNNLLRTAPCTDC